ncbi:MAG: zinc-dependent metalloprotease [Ilumatobacteraceae bacterium]
MADDPGTDGTDDVPNPFGSGPFAGMPLFGDMARALQGQGPLNWDAARQFALLSASEGRSEPNVDPSVRIAHAELARIAGMHVNDVTGSDTTFPEPRVVTRSQWAVETLDAYRPLFNDLATALSRQPDGGADDPMAAMMAGLSKMLQPTMMGLAVGSMGGARAKQGLGRHDRPSPRPVQEVGIITGTIDEFAAEWGIPLDPMRLWVLAHELSGYQLFSIDALREGLATLVRSYAGGFRPDPSAIADHLSGFDPMAGGDPMAALQQAFSDPEVLLGAVQSPEQRELQPKLDAAVAAVVGVTDWVVDAVAARLIGGEALRIAEAVRRRRVERSSEDLFVEKLLGIRVGDDQVVRGKSFVQGVVDRVGEHGLTRLLREHASLPTPSELDAPGLWIARVTAT